VFPFTVICCFGTKSSAAALVEVLKAKIHHGQAQQQHGNHIMEKNAYWFTGHTN